MDRTEVAKSLLKLAKELSREASNSPQSQDVIQALKPVQKGIIGIREAMRLTGQSREADQAFLKLNGLVNDLIKELKKY